MKLLYFVKKIGSSRQKLSIILESKVFQLLVHIFKKWQEQTMCSNTDIILWIKSEGFKKKMMKKMTLKIKFWPFFDKLALRLLQ